MVASPGTCKCVGYSGRRVGWHGLPKERGQFQINSLDQIPFVWNWGSLKLPHELWWFLETDGYSLLLSRILFSLIVQSRGEIIFHEIPQWSILGILTKPIIWSLDMECFWN
jgi:hypothetical protein